MEKGSIGPDKFKLVLWKRSCLSGFSSSNISSDLPIQILLLGQGKSCAWADQRKDEINIDFGSSPK
jgi:hypothetical protein